MTHQCVSQKKKKKDPSKYNKNKFIIILKKKLYLEIDISVYKMLYGKICRNMYSNHAHVRNRKGNKAKVS